MSTRCVSIYTCVNTLTLTVSQNALAMSKWGQWDDSFGTERRRNFACMCPGFEDAGAGYEDNISEES